jgi:hypothetical protein
MFFRERGIEMIRSTGEEPLENHDSANIVCNIFISKLSEEDLHDLDLRWDEEEWNEEGDVEIPNKWARFVFTADVFMPRKGLHDGAYQYIASTREELQELVREKVLPSYEIGLQAVKDLADGKRTSFYYWDPTKPEDHPDIADAEDD